MNGHVDVLRWWKHSGLEHEWSAAFEWASQLRAGVVEAKWPRVCLTDDPMTAASSSLNGGDERSRTHVDLAMDHASEAGQIKALDWWKGSELERKYTDYTMNNASLTL
ncbi:hypothetical protein BJ742DRAFT_778442 [Cladochytrium replicatum]|nr:hypothetical protein BJ742DRAFT_778442 [Cladochytrium replicatum]